MDDRGDLHNTRCTDQGPISMGELTGEIQGPISMGELTGEIQDPISMGELTGEIQDPISMGELTGEIQDPISMGELTGEIQDSISMDELTGKIQDSISKFLARSKELSPLSVLSLESVTENWSAEDWAPGHQLADYQPLSNLTHGNDNLTTQSSMNQTAESVTQSSMNQTAESVTDALDPAAEIGVCGLVNIGNTCYMNAGLQCICSVPQIVHYYLTHTHSLSDLHVEDQMIACRAQLNTTFATIVRKLWCGKFGSVQPKVFKSAVSLLYPQFSGYRQHDCQEFLAILLDGLHEHLATTVDQMMPTLSGTVISNTFQGQLRNEVECSTCRNVSTKIEPFVYLSLPLPRAYDKFIELYHVSSESPLSVTRLAVKVCRYGSTVHDIKVSLIQLLDTDISSDLLLLAEVLNCSVVRTLVDTLPVSSLNVKRGEKLYMFEMIPANELVALIQTDTDPWASSSSSQSVNSASSQDVHSTSLKSLDLFGAESFSNENSKHPLIESEDIETETTPTATLPSAVFVEWHTCSICLEEMLDSDLLMHVECGGTLCTECLTLSKAHQESSGGQSKTNCPICSKPLREESGFIKAATEVQQTNSSTISLLLVMILFQSSGKLVGHPILKHLPTHCFGAFLYSEITKVLLPSFHSQAFTLRLTDDKGRWCSRCNFLSHCTGCLVSRSTGTAVSLRPGDHITVQFSTALDEKQSTLLSSVIEHPSVSELMPCTVTLQNCLKAFSQRETISSDNSWYCPRCKGQRSAEHTLTVDKLPEMLIIHLKRFIYHGRDASKVEVPVSLPLEMEVKEECETVSTHLELRALVCHTGTLQYGHYTAYCKHPISQQWVYYNDSSTSKVSEPSEGDVKNAYMLFYWRPAAPFPAEQLESSEVEFDDSNELAFMKILEEKFKPPAAPSRSHPLLLKKHNSNPDLTSGIKGQSDEHGCKVRAVSVCPW